MMHGRRDLAVWSVATGIIFFCFGAVIIHGVSWLLARNTGLSALYLRDDGSYSPEAAGGMAFGIITLLLPALAIGWLLNRWLRFGYRIWLTTRRG